MMGDISHSTSAISAGSAFLPSMQQPVHPADEALASPESTFDARGTLDALSDAFFAVDANWRFTFVNRAAARSWQRSAESLIGRVMWDEFPSLNGTPFEAAYRRAAEHHEPVVLNSYAGVDGRWYELRIFPGAAGLVAFYRDTSALKEAELALERVSAESERERRANEEALRNDARRQDEFIATLAHELRNPLAPIRNALEVARLAKGNDVAIEYAHGVMERQMSHMVRLIDELLDLSRLKLGKIKLKIAPVELGTVLESAIETVRPHIERSGHALELNLPDESLCIEADSTRLMQVFANLLSNAVKFTANNGSVWVTASREDDDAVVRVKDSGIGMAPTMLEQVFDMFTQEAEALNRTEGGLGIGLTLVKGLVNLHGGTVSATSEGKGLGSEFVVTLPLSKSGAAHGRRPTNPRASTPTTWRRILVVDDNADSATSLSMMLNFMGHDTRTSNDGASGLEIAETFRPDVYLLDIGMPNLNGYDLARRIRAQEWGADAVLIALSGWGQEHDQERSRNAGFDMHFVKPVDPASLAKALSRTRSACD